MTVHRAAQHTEYYFARKYLLTGPQYKQATITRRAVPKHKPSLTSINTSLHFRTVACRSGKQNRWYYVMYDVYMYVLNTRCASRIEALSCLEEKISRLEFPRQKDFEKYWLLTQFILWDFGTTTIFFICNIYIFQGGKTLMERLFWFLLRHYCYLQ